VIFRFVLLATGGLALIASLAVERPERFAFIWPSALLTVIVAAGAIAADAVPLRRIPLVCSVATFILGALLFSRAEVQVPLAAAIVVVQIIGIAARLTRSQPRAHDVPERPVYTRHQ
jgi:hypothetical protein